MDVNLNSARIRRTVDSLLGPLSQGTLSVFNMGQAIFLASSLGLGDYGQYALAIAIFATFSSGEFGFGNTAISRLTSNPEHALSETLSHEIYNLGLKFKAHVKVISIGLAIILLASSLSKHLDMNLTFLESFNFDNFLVVAVIYIASMISPLIGMYRSYLILNKKSYALLSKQIVGSGLTLVLLFFYELFAEITIGTALFFSLLISQLFLLVSFLKLYLVLPKLNRTTFVGPQLVEGGLRELRNQIFHFYLLAIAATSSMYMHIFIIGYLFDKKTVGAMFLLFRIYQFGSSVNMIGFNNFVADIKKSNNLYDFTLLLKSQLRHALAYATFSIVVIGVSLPLITKILPDLSGEFINLTSILVFSFYILVTVPIGSLTSICNAYGFVGIQLALSLLTTLITIGASLLLSGYIGFTVSILSFTVIQLFITVPVLGKYLQVNLQKRKFEVGLD